MPAIRMDVSRGRTDSHKHLWIQVKTQSLLQIVCDTVLLYAASDSAFGDVLPESWCDIQQFGNLNFQKWKLWPIAHTVHICKFTNYITE